MESTLILNVLRTAASHKRNCELQRLTKGTANNSVSQKETANCSGSQKELRTATSDTVTHKELRAGAIHRKPVSLARSRATSHKQLRRMIALLIALLIAC